MIRPFLIFRSFYLHWKYSSCFKHPCGYGQLDLESENMCPTSFYPRGTKSDEPYFSPTPRFGPNYHFYRRKILVVAKKSCLAGFGGFRCHTFTYTGKPAWNGKWGLFVRFCIQVSKCDKNFRSIKILEWQKFSEHKNTRMAKIFGA